MDLPVTHPVQIRGRSNSRWLRDEDLGRLRRVDVMRRFFSAGCRRFLGEVGDMKDKKKKKSRNELSSAESATGAGSASGSVARVTEIIASSPKSFEDAVVVGVDRACKTLQNVTGAWVQDQKVEISDGKITAFRVNLKVTFILND